MMYKKQRTRQRPLSENTTNKKISRYTEHYRSRPQDIIVSSKKNPLTDKRHVVNRAKVHAGSLPTYIAVVLLLLCALYATSLNGTVSIVQGQHNGLLPAEHYEKQASELLSSIASAKTKISFDTQDFAEKLKAKIPELDTVTVSVPIVGRSVTVGVTYVKPAFLYAQQGETYVLGANGVILAKTTDIPNVSATIANLRTITDKTPIKVSVGQTVLLGTDIDFMTTVFSELSKNQVAVREAILPQGAGEVHMVLSDKNYYVKFSLLGDVRQQAGAFLATVDQVSDITEYVDVRLGERVFVK